MLGQDPSRTGGADETVRLGILGCGRQAERGQVPAAERARGVALAGVADTDPSRCVGAAPGIPAFGSAEELLAEAIDAVVIATPTGDHLAAARRAAAAGIAALVEKPPAPDAGSATELAALPVPVWIGFNRRFDPDLEALRERLRDERGLSLTLRLDFPIRAWRPRVSHDDALLDLGTHLIDMARWLLGAEPRRVRAMTLTAARASLELDLGDDRATIDCASNRFWREEVAVDRGRGGRLADHRRGGVARVALSRLGVRRRDDGFVSSLTRQLEALAREVRGGGDTPLASAADGVTALAAVDAARESGAAGGEWRAVNLPARSVA
jgi:predicted dehydrogenase